MASHSAVQSARQYVVRLGCRLLSRDGASPGVRPEFAWINREAGIEPVRPEFSGLKVRKPPSVAYQAQQATIQLQYSWQPSDGYRARAVETQRVNHLQRHPFQPVLPPVLRYDQETVVAPERLRPFLSEETRVGGVLSDRKAVRDLHDLEVRVRQQDPVVIGPLVTEADQSYFLTYRPLLPRACRAFLRHSLYPPAVATVIGVVLIVAVISWTGEANRVEAIANVPPHSMPNGFGALLHGALAHGVDPRNLHPLRLEVRSWASVSMTSGVVSSGARLHAFRLQGRRDVVLRAAVQRLEHRAFDYWTWREGVAYAPLMEATQQARALGLQEPIPPLPACGTARCFQRAIVTQQASTSRLRRAIVTVRRDASTMVAP